jgi:formylglycine-generating enzyme required for sulfatase activity
MQRRAQEFKAWQKAHPHPDKEIAQLKAKTATEVKAYLAKATLADNSADAPPVIWRVKGAISEIIDCKDCPDMVVVPAGAYTMGSPATETGRDKGEEPMHRVTITYPFAVGKYDVTRIEFAQFVADSGYNAKGKCFSRDAKDQGSMSEMYNWETPGFKQSDSDPVVCINGNDADAYVAWLSKKTGKPYRLLSESEWEYAARAGTVTSRWWGDSPLRLKVDEVGGAGAIITHPVDATLPNAFGLYGMSGSVWQWLGDCWNENYTGAPTDGSAWRSGDCTRRTLRGGSTASFDSSLRSAARHPFAIDGRFHNYGFRVGRSL